MKALALLCLLLALNYYQRRRKSVTTAYIAFPASKFASRIHRTNHDQKAVENDHHRIATPAAKSAQNRHHYRR